MKAQIALILGLCLCLVGPAGMAGAALVQVDFNDLATGSLKTQGGGTGLAGTWGGSGTLQVAANDLTAPAATNFALVQSGTAQMLRGSYAAPRANNRGLSTDLNGDVWFSFLVEPTSGVTRAGIEINPTLGSSDPSGARLIALGTTLHVLGSVPATSFTNQFTVDQTSLVLGRIEIDHGGAGEDRLSLWVDPNVTFIDEAAALHPSSDTDWLSSVSGLGIESYRSGGSAGDEGMLDLISLADGPGAYQQVTGVAPLPPPVVFQQGVSPTPAYTADSTAVRANQPTTPQDGDTDHENIVGRLDSGFMRGMFEFDLTELDTQGVFPASVELQMTTRIGAGMGANPLLVNLYQYDSDFVEAAATWNDPDGDGNPATGDTTPGGSLGNILAQVAINPADQGTQVIFSNNSALTSAVNSALASGDKTLRLMATRASEDGSGYHFARFSDDDHPTLAWRPALAVTPGSEPPPTVVVIDDGLTNQLNPRVALDGTWAWRPESGASSKPNSYLDTGSRFALAADTSAKATYTPDLPEGGTYQVAVTWPTFDWTADALVTVHHAGGTSTFDIDQSDNVGSGFWRGLGMFQFDAGTGGSVEITYEGPDVGGSGVGPVIDAVRFATGDFVPVMAADVVASSTHPSNDHRMPIRVIDGSGMSDADGNYIADTHASSSSGAYINWMSDGGDVAEEWLAIDLGQSYNLDHMEVFNFNASNSLAAGRGVSQADVYVSSEDDPGMTAPDFSNSSVWQLVAADVQFNEATGPFDGGSGSPYNTPDTLDLAGFTGRWLALDIDANWGGSFVGLGEILVYPAAAPSQVVPEPSSLALLLLGALGLGWIARRRRR